MRSLDYNKNWEKLLTPEIVALLTQIHEYKGKQVLFIGAKADVLTQLVEIAKIGIFQTEYIHWLPVEFQNRSVLRSSSKIPTARSQSRRLWKSVRISVV